MLSIARHTETEEFLVLYEPLYENAWLNNLPEQSIARTDSPKGESVVGAKYCVRPYDMFIEKVLSPETGEQVDRFQFVRET